MRRIIRFTEDEVKEIIKTHLEANSYKIVMDTAPLGIKYPCIEIRYDQEDGCIVVDCAVMAGNFLSMCK